MFQLVCLDSITESATIVEDSKSSVLTRGMNLSMNFRSCKQFSLLCSTEKRNLSHLSILQLEDKIILILDKRNFFVCGLFNRSWMRLFFFFLSFFLLFYSQGWFRPIHQDPLHDRERCERGCQTGVRRRKIWSQRILRQANRILRGQGRHENRKVANQGLLYGYFFSITEVKQYWAWLILGSETVQGLPECCCWPLKPVTFD